MVPAVGDTPSLTRESIGKCARAEQVSRTVPPLAPPTGSAPAQQRGLPCPGIPKALPPYNLAGGLRQKYGPNDRTEQNFRKKTKQWERANLSDGEFKALVIKMLTELIENWSKNEKTNERYPK